MLAGTRLGTLTVAAFGVAVLLAPFYRIVANACWKRGVAMVLDPGQWWSAWRDAYGEMMTGKVPGAAADGEESQKTAPRELVAVRASHSLMALTATCRGSRQIHDRTSCQPRSA